MFDPWRYMAPSIVPYPFDAVQLSCPLCRKAEKHPQSIMSPPPCLTVGMVFLWSLAVFLLLQTRQVELMPKSWIFRLQTCAFLSRGTLRAPQDFSPSRRSVLPIVFLVTMVPAALRSLTRSSRVVLGWFLMFSRSLKLHEVRSCMEPQSEGDW